MNPDEEQKDVDRVKAVAEALGEHFDSVSILVSRYEPSIGGTVKIYHGVGNWFTRLGQIDQWLEQERETSRCIARARYEEP